MQQWLTICDEYFSMKEKKRKNENFCENNFYNDPVTHSETECGKCI